MKIEDTPEKASERLFPITDEMSSYEKYIVASQRHGFLRGVDFAKKHPYPQAEQYEIKPGDIVSIKKTFRFSPVSNKGKVIKVTGDSSLIESENGRIEHVFNSQLILLLESGKEEVKPEGEPEIFEYKLMADFPNSKYQVGDIVTAYKSGTAYLTQYGVDKYSMNDYPHLFKLLESSLPQPQQPDPAIPQATYTCPVCNGDGKETCTNPDHGFISGMGFHDIGRLGCPCCGHDEKHKVPNGGDCEECSGTGKVDLSTLEKILDSYQINNDPDDYLIKQTDIPQPEQPEQAVVIIHKGGVFNNKAFTSIEQARNYLKWQFPKRKWKEPEENTMVCAYQGTKFQIIELNF